MNDEQFYRVTFVRANGFQYETTGRASNEAEAVRLADELLENVERIGIADFLAIISATPFTCPRADPDVRDSRSRAECVCKPPPTIGPHEDVDAVCLLLDAADTDREGSDLGTLDAVEERGQEATTHVKVRAVPEGLDRGLRCWQPALLLHTGQAGKGIAERRLTLVPDTGVKNSAEVRRDARASGRATKEPSSPLRVRRPGTG